jgi:hypothetical protein
MKSVRLARIDPGFSSRIKNPRKTPCTNAGMPAYFGLPNYGYFSIAVFEGLL